MKNKFNIKKSAFNFIKIPSIFELYQVYVYEMGQNIKLIIFQFIARSYSPNRLHLNLEESLHEEYGSEKSSQ